MSDEIEYAHVIAKRGTASEWAAHDDVLLEGELGILVQDPPLVDVVKSGDGRTPFSQLEAISGDRGPQGLTGAPGVPGSPAVMPALGVTFAVVDTENRLSWLQVGPDGRPTAASLKILRADLGNLPEPLPNPEIAFVILDNQNRRSEIEIGRDGRLTQRVIDSIASRITGSSLADPAAIVLPSVLDLTVGQTYHLEYSGIVDALSADHRMLIAGMPAGGSQNYGGYWEFTPTVTGSFSLTFTLVSRSGTTILTRSVPVTVRAAASRSTLRHLPIGDSITRDGRYADAAVKALGGVTVGTRQYGASGYPIEGRGGWQLATYFTQIGSPTAGDSPFLFPTTVTDGAKFWGNTEFWRKVGYVPMANLPTAGYDFDGFQKMARGWIDGGPLVFDSNGYPTSPAEGDVVVDPTKAAGSQWLQYTSGAWATIPSPSIEFSFPKYMQRYAAAFAAGAPTSISVMLETNDFFGGISDGSFALWKTRLDSLIASVRAWNASVPITILLAPTGGRPESWAPQTVQKDSFDHTIRAAAQRIISAYDTDAARANRVHVATFLGSIAPANMSDHVHPQSPAGHVQMAPFLTGKLSRLIAEGSIA